MKTYSSLSYDTVLLRSSSEFGIQSMPFSQQCIIIKSIITEHQSDMNIFERAVDAEDLALIGIFIRVRRFLFSVIIRSV